MGEVVYNNEFGIPRIGVISGGLSDAKAYLASQMYTDAVFNGDIRVIQTIIGRVDGGLPKDTDVDEYQTLFGDCMNEVLVMTSNQQLKVLPTDTVMMALCKSLYDIATRDIYHVVKADKHGNRASRKVNPSTEAKNARDSALRMVLERAGGRKTAVPKNPTQRDVVRVADWIQQALPQEEERDDREPSPEAA